MSRNALLVLGGLILVTAFGVQFRQISKLRNELATVKAELGGGAPVAESSGSRSAVIPTATAAARSNNDGTAVAAGIQSRLAALENSVAEFTKAADMLMDRGMIPPNEQKLAEMQAKFMDPSLSEDEKLRLFQMMRRGGNLSEEVVAQALTMMQSTTNNNFKQQILQGFSGLTNSTLKQPLFAMLQTETDNNVRAQLVNALRNYTDDPAIESKLWEMAINDPNANVRNRARDAVTRGAPVTPERVQRLAQTTRDPNAAIDDRLLSFRALRIAKAHTPEMVTELAALAESTTDPVDKAKLLASFNGLTEPALMLPLVTALQNDNPAVRRSAADSLGSYSDPRVVQWLEHVVKNDTDEKVRAEATRALEAARRLANGQGQGQQGQADTVVRLQ
ncbi:MAG TPA: HEAT repeat domain-containing protein [Verrucomicrobiae bacterium]